jgi:hypothetical protein
VVGCVAKVPFVVVADDISEGVFGLGEIPIEDMASIELALDFGDGTPILRAVRSGKTPIVPALAPSYFRYYGKSDQNHNGRSRPTSWAHALAGG